MPLPKFTLDEETKTFYLHKEGDLTFEMIVECQQIIQRIYTHLQESGKYARSFKFVQVNRKAKIDAFLLDAVEKNA